MLLQLSAGARECGGLHSDIIPEKERERGGNSTVTKGGSPLKTYFKAQCTCEFIHVSVMRMSQEKRIVQTCSGGFFIQWTFPQRQYFISGSNPGSKTSQFLHTSLLYTLPDLIKSSISQTCAIYPFQQPILKAAWGQLRHVLFFPPNQFRQLLCTLYCVV